MSYYDSSHELRRRMLNVLVTDRTNILVEHINRQIIMAMGIPSHLFFDERSYQAAMNKWKRDGEELAALRQRLQAYHL